MSLILKSTLKYTDGKLQRRDASNSYLQVSPDKLRGPYSLSINAQVQGRIIDVNPLDITSEDESYTPMYGSLAGLDVEFIFYPAYNVKDYLFFSTKAQKKLNKVGVVPANFVITVEITTVKNGFLSKKVYPMAKIFDSEVEADEK